MDLGVATLIGGLVSAGTTAATSIGGAMRSLKKNKDLAQYQNELAMNNWLTQQSYNTPEAQMARLREAGLNPHLMYGNGNFVNSANQAPETPDIAPVDFTEPYSRIGQAVSQGINSVIQSRQINLDMKYKNVEITKMLDDLITSEQNRLVQLRELKLKVDDNSREWTRLDQQERELQSRLKTYEKQRDQIDTNIEMADRENEREDMRLTMEINREPYVLKDLMASTGLKKNQAKQAFETARKLSVETDNYQTYVDNIKAQTKVSYEQARKIAVETLVEESVNAYAIYYGYPPARTAIEKAEQIGFDLSNRTNSVTISDIRFGIEKSLGIERKVQDTK